MNHLQFTREEIDRLVQMKESIQKQVDELEKENIFPNSVHPEILAKDFESFSNRRTEYENLFSKYKNQLFYIVRKENWSNDLQVWINKICIEKEINEHHYLDLSSLNAYLHTLIFHQYPSYTEPTPRMINALITEQGYDKGFGIIQELLSEEQDEKIKSELESRIKKYKAFSPYKNQLLNIVQTDVKNILPWTKSNELTVNNSYEILIEFNHFLDYSDKLLDTRLIEDELDNVLDELWEIIEKNK